MSVTTIDCTCAQKRLNGLNHKKSSIFMGSRKIAKNQGKFRWVIKESSVAGLAGMHTTYIQLYHLYHCAYLTPHSNHVFLIYKSVAPSSLWPCKYFLNSIFPPNLLYKSNLSSPFPNSSASLFVRLSSTQAIKDYKELHACHLVSHPYIKTKSERYRLWSYSKFSSA